MRKSSIVKIAFESSSERGLVGSSFSYGPEENLFCFLVEHQVKVVNLYFWVMSYERINKARGERPA